MQFYNKSLLQPITIVLHFRALKLIIHYKNDNNLLLIGMNISTVQQVCLKKTSLLMVGEPLSNKKRLIFLFYCI